MRVLSAGPQEAGQQQTPGAGFLRGGGLEGAGVVWGLGELWGGVSAPPVDTSSLFSSILASPRISPEESFVWPKQFGTPQEIGPGGQVYGLWNQTAGYKLAPPDHCVTEGRTPLKAGFLAS